MTATQLSSPDAPAISSATQRILIVDDQAEVAEFLLELTRLIGFDGVVETNPQRALDLVAEEHFDVIVSDFRMPEMTGIEFYRAVADIRAELAWRFVFLTGDLFNVETQEVLSITGAPCIAKPFRLAVVEKILNEVCAAA
jgi:CheY-like chemotaxis protein